MSKKSVVIVAGIVVVAAAVGIGMKLRSSGPEGLEVEVEPVERMTVVQTVSATGRIQPQTQVNISADVSAKIIRMPVEEGDWVEKGQLLLELDRNRYVAAVESSEASLRVAGSNAEVIEENKIKAGKDLKRIQELFDRELETQERLDAAEAAYKAGAAQHRSALDQVAQAEAALKQMRDDLSKTTIYAPMSGTVSELNKEVGEIALGSQFQEDVILVVSNLSGMEALVDVDENDIVSVDVGDPATIEVDALPDVKLQGRVTDIANSAKQSGAGTTEQKTEFEIKIEIIDPVGALRPGMTASAEVVTETREDVIGIPIQSVAVRTLDQLGAATDGADGPGPATEWRPDSEGFVEVVWVIENGTARARQVRTGIQSDTHIEIVEGVGQGDQVVVGNYRAISRDLEHGLQVVVQGEGRDDAG